MTNEEMCTRLDDELQEDIHDITDEEVTTTERLSVRDMILHFESTSNLIGSTDSLSRNKDYLLGSLTSITNPLQMNFQRLYPATKSLDRNSNVSVNSILSNTSEMSFESSSSGFVSDRKSGADYPVPSRPAPPPPEPFNDAASVCSKSSGNEEPPVELRRYSFTPSTSPIVKRRSRQPPVMRKKSIVNNPSNTGETLWTYGVKQCDLEKLLCLKQSESSDIEEDSVSKTSELNYHNRNSSESVGSSGSCKSSSDNNFQEDSVSRDLSTDTLINENEGSEIGDDNSSTASDARSNYDNVSIKSISSFDMVPYQRYDSITVSSDEFGSEECHGDDSEFLTVSAINDWCISKLTPTPIPVETKKEKYRRQLTERVKELILTESAYVKRLRLVIDEYIPEIAQQDVPSDLKLLKPDIFANIEKIHKFHDEQFLPALKECGHDLKKLGQCFRKFEPLFNMYVMYSRNNKRATRLVFEHKQFFQVIQSRLQDRLDLSSYLLEPVQRIPRYRLFLNDLIKTYNNFENERYETESRISKLSVDSDETGGSNGESSDTEETPLESLTQAKTMIECVLTAIDGIMALENIRNCPPYINLLNQGRLLRQNEFYAMDPTRRKKQLMRVFLFDKLVLITVVFKKQQTVEVFIYKEHIPVDDLGITVKEHDQHKFTIWYKKRNIKSYKMETRDPAIRDKWVEDITSLLWEQAMKKKELLLQQRSKRNSMVSMNSQESGSDAMNDDKYNSLRGVPGEVRRTLDNKVRRTTWYCE